MSQLVETEHVVPMPAVAGWTDEKRAAEMERLRKECAEAGGQIVKEQRVRNIAFDDRGERTTWKFIVRWEPEPIAMGLTA